MNGLPGPPLRLGAVPRRSARPPSTCARWPTGRLDGFVDCTDDGLAPWDYLGGAPRVPRGGRRRCSEVDGRELVDLDARRPAQRRRRCDRRSWPTRWSPRGPIPEPARTDRRLVRSMSRSADAAQRGLLRVYRRLPTLGRRWVVRTIAPSFTVGAMAIIERADGVAPVRAPRLPAALGRARRAARAGRDPRGGGGPRGAGGGRPAHPARSASPRSSSTPSPSGSTSCSGPARSTRPRPTGSSRPRPRSSRPAGSRRARRPSSSTRPPARWSPSPGRRAPRSPRRSREGRLQPDDDPGDEVDVAADPAAGEVHAVAADESGVGLHRRLPVHQRDLGCARDERVERVVDLRLPPAGHVHGQQDELAAARPPEQLVEPAVRGSGRCCPRGPPRCSTARPARRASRRPTRCRRTGGPPRRRPTRW